MATELKIVWDGDVPGLSEHRLSVDAFGGSLENLLTALRRIAMQIMSNAVEGESSQTGRFNRAARQLDIELTNLVEGSTGIQGIVSFTETPLLPMHLFPDLAAHSASELIDAIDKESHGRPANGAVRRYLRSLPRELKRQEYTLYEAGREVRKIEVGDLALTELPADLPFLEVHEGDIVGVGFEPGRTEIRIKAGSITGVAAAPEEVDKALNYRGKKVRVISVHAGTRNRLISLKSSEEPKFKISKEAVEEHLFRRWDGLLRRLAR